MAPDRNATSGYSDEAAAAGGTHRLVTSLQNDSVKLIRSLEMRKARRETGLFVAEGTSLLISAREHGWAPRMLVSGPGAADSDLGRALAGWAARSGADRLDVSVQILEKLAAKDNPQSVIGVFEQRWHDAATLARPGASDLWVALEGVRDPGNLGTILRTIDAAGATGVILVGATCDPFSHEAVRASMGSIFAVPVARVEPAAFLALAKAWPGDVVGTHLSGRLDYRDAGCRDPVLLVMGNEGAGLTAEATAVCGKLVRIPMAGSLDSLNLAVATALMLFEIRRPKLRL